jgi:hypothetical protein
MGNGVAVFIVPVRCDLDEVAKAARKVICESDGGAAVANAP